MKVAPTLQFLKVGATSCLLKVSIDVVGVLHGYFLIRMILLTAFWDFPKLSLPFATSVHLYFLPLFNNLLGILKYVPPFLIWTVLTRFPPCMMVNVYPLLLATFFHVTL